MHQLQAPAKDTSAATHASRNRNAHSAFVPAVVALLVVMLGGAGEYDGFVSAASDAHRAADVGNGIEEAIAYIKSFGIREITAFRHKIPYFIKV